MKLLKGLLPIVILIIFSYFYVNKFFISNYLSYGEERAYINYDSMNYRYNSIWGSKNNFGSITQYTLLLPTLGTFWNICKQFNLSLLNTEKLFIFVFVFFSLLFSYLSIKYFTKRILISIILSLLFISTYNYYSGVFYSLRLIHYLLLPLTLFLWLKYDETNNYLYVFVNLLLSILLISIGANPPQMIGAYSFIILYVIFSTESKKIVNSVIFLAPLLLNIIFVAIFHLLYIQNSGNIIHTDPFLLNWSASASSISQIFRFFGGWWDYGSHRGLMYNNLTWYYHSDIGFFITYLPIFIVTLLLVTSVRQKLNLKIRVIFLLLIFIFFAKGSAFPFNLIFDFLFTINIFKIFREPWAKFVPNVIFLVYIAIAVLSIDLNIKIYRVIVVLLGIVLIFQLIPFIFNKHLVDRNRDWRKQDVVIPSYWLNLQKWSQKYLVDKRVLILPATATDGAQLVNNWTPYIFHGDPSEFFLYTNSISNSSSNPEEKYIMNDFFHTFSNRSILATSIDYVLSNNDALIDSKNIISVKDIEPFINKNEKKSFGNLDLYPVIDSYHSNIIRSINNIQYHKEDNCTLGMLRYMPNINSILINRAVPNNVGLINNYKINFSKIDNTTYKINIDKNLDKNLGLLFSQTFNNGWKIYNSNSLFSKPILDEKYHFIGNCYFNFWIIPDNIINNNAYLYLSYEPQKLFNRVIVIYIIATLIISISSCFILSTKK